MLQFSLEQQLKSTLTLKPLVYIQESACSHLLFPKMTMTSCCLYHRHRASILWKQQLTRESQLMGAVHGLEHGQLAAHTGQEKTCGLDPLSSLLLGPPQGLPLAQGTAHAHSTKGVASGLTKTSNQKSLLIDLFMTLIDLFMKTKIRQSEIKKLGH